MKADGKRRREMESMNMEGSWGDRNRSRDTGDGWAEDRRGYSFWTGGKDGRGEAASKRSSQGISSRAGLPPTLPQEMYS